MKKVVLVLVLILLMILMSPLVNFHCADCPHYKDIPSTTQNQVMTDTLVMPAHANRAWYFLNR